MGGVEHDPKEASFDIRSGCRSRKIRCICMNDVSGTNQNNLLKVIEKIGVFRLQFVKDLV